MIKRLRPPLFRVHPVPANWQCPIRYSCVSDSLGVRGYLEILQRIPNREQAPDLSKPDLEPEYMLRIGLGSPQVFHPKAAEMVPIFNRLHRLRISPFAAADILFDAGMSYLILDSGHASCTLRWNAHGPEGWRKLRPLVSALNGLAEKYAGEQWGVEEERFRGNARQLMREGRGLSRT